MKITIPKLRRIIRKTLTEGTYEKLNADVTGDSANLDQEVFFGLMEDVEALSEILGVLPSEIPTGQTIGEALSNKYANNPRYADHGVTPEDVLEELNSVLSEI